MMIFNIFKAAHEIVFNRKISGLNSKNVQGAIDEVSSNINNHISSMEVQVINIKTGLTLILQGKLAILKFEGYSYTQDETIITDSKYRPYGTQYRNMMRVYNSSQKYYDGLVSVKNDGTITMSYLSAQGTGPNTSPVANGKLYGEIVYIIM